jgi:DNA polymerase III epsilon subunit-like protein
MSVPCPWVVRDNVSTEVAMIWFVLVLLLVAAVIYFRRKKNQIPTSPTGRVSRQSTGPTPALRGAIYTQPRAQPSPSASDGIAFASPGRKGELFTYGGPASRGTSHPHDGAYAVVDVETTGFSPRQGDRVIEIAVARVDASGRVEDEFATLINPEGRDTGPVFVHGITNEAVAKAPTFADVVPELLARLDGAVVVAHNAAFEERFLAAELMRAGHRSLRMPALCSLWLGQQTFQTPNHKLGTLARHAGIPLVDKHAALGDVRAVAALLPQMIDRYGQPIHYGCPPFTSGGPMGAGDLRLVTRAVELRKGTDGWMQSLMARLPMSANEGDDAAVEAYLDALAEVLADGKIVGEEAKALAKLAGGAGMGAVQVAALNERFLESLRDAAFDDDILTVAELRQLNGAAKALGVPDYFDDLVPTPAAPAPAVVSAAAPTSASPESGGGAPTHTRSRRCGHCRAPGHNRSRCPELV